MKADEVGHVKTIKDSVHDHIEVDGVARALLDTPSMQRLRHIRQLGTVQLVYPSANHTRFEHSLGVYHLARRATDHLGIAGRRAQRIHAAALLHDIGHAPFSHNVERIMERYTGTGHDEVHDRLTDGDVGEILADHDLDPSRVADLIAGTGIDGQLIAGELDVDRMDYLVRDAHHTGVPYGTIDHGRLVRELRFVDDELVLGPGNVETAESLLTARALMNPIVYNHHVARISKTMLRRGVERLIDADQLTSTDLSRIDDHDLLVGLRTAEQTADIARRLSHRDLYKRAVWAEIGAVPDEILDADYDQITAAEREIAATADVDPTSVMLDIPDRPCMRESTSRVIVNGRIRRLDEQSPLVAALRAGQRNQWRLGVYAPRAEVDQVGHAAERVLGLDVDGILVNDAGPGRFTTLDRFRDERT